MDWTQFNTVYINTEMNSSLQEVFPRYLFAMKGFFDPFGFFLNQKLIYSSLKDEQDWNQAFFNERNFSKKNGLFINWFVFLVAMVCISILKRESQGERKMDTLFSTGFLPKLCSKHLKQKKTQHHPMSCLVLFLLQ